jgi:hypothetical protein
VSQPGACRHQRQVRLKGQKAERILPATPPLYWHVFEAVSADRLHGSLQEFAAVRCSLTLPDGAGNLHWFLLNGTSGGPTRLVGTLVAQQTAAGAAIAAQRVICSDDPALRFVVSQL